jgi:hypothetical protein
MADLSASWQTSTADAQVPQYASGASVAPKRSPLIPHHASPLHCLVRGHDRRKTADHERGLHQAISMRRCMLRPLPWSRIRQSHRNYRGWDDRLHRRNLESSWMKTESLLIAWFVRPTSSVNKPRHQDALMLANSAPGKEEREINAAEAVPLATPSQTDQAHIHIQTVIAYSRCRTRRIPFLGCP